MNDQVSARSHISVPDWSVVRSDIAWQALQAAADTLDMARKWAELDPAEDRVRRAILAAYARTGAAPNTGELSRQTRLAIPAVQDTLDRLRARDLVVLGPEGRIVGAYPFTDCATEHHVVVRGKTVSAMCAIDALGMGAMLGTDTRIRSACRHCKAPIEAATRESGQSLGAITPATAVVWSGVQYDTACAATSLCTVQAFFCSEEHLAAWREDGADGFRLSIDEAFQVGKAIFGPMLQSAA